MSFTNKFTKGIAYVTEVGTAETAEDDFRKGPNVWIPLGDESGRSPLQRTKRCLYSCRTLAPVLYEAVMAGWSG